LTEITIDLIKKDLQPLAPFSDTRMSVVAQSGRSRDPHGQIECQQATSKGLFKLQVLPCDAANSATGIAHAGIVSKVA
jgi:hypothetical protein